MRRRASPTGSTTGSASASACKFNTPRRPPAHHRISLLLGNSNSQRRRLGLWLHRRRHADPDADHHHRYRLSFGDQSEDQRHAVAPTGALLPTSTPGVGQHHAQSPRHGQRRPAPALGPQWTLLGTVEWSNWSRIGTSNVSAEWAPATWRVAALPFQFQRRLVLLGRRRISVEPQLAVRAGIGFEKSPITDAVRTPALPDNDRIWLSFGATYSTPKLTFDFAYSHLFVKTTPINLGAGNPASYRCVWTYIGAVNSHVDIVSVALKYRWDDPAAPAPGRALSRRSKRALATRRRRRRPCSFGRPLRQRERESPMGSCRQIARGSEQRVRASRGPGP